jgi:hypothetical protein
MPGVPRYESQPSDVAASAVIEHKFKLVREVEGDGYEVRYADLPASVPEDKLSAVLDQAVDAVRTQRNPKDEFKSVASMEVAGHPGREVVIHRHGSELWVMRKRFCIVKKRTYQVSVLTTEAQAKSSNVKTFLDSFRLRDE